VTDKYPQLHLNNQLCFSVYTLSRLITQAYQPLLKELGLTYPQYLALLVLWQAAEEGSLPVPVKHLCENLLLDTGTVTPLLKRLESSGLVKRSRSEEDERVVRIGLTEAGLALRERASGIPEQILCSSGINVTEGAQIKTQLQGVIEQLQKS